MASRHLKRLQQAAEANAEEAATDESDDSSPPAKAKPNLFQLLDEETQSSPVESDADEDADESDLSSKQVASSTAAKNSKRRPKAKAKRSAKQQHGKPVERGKEEDLDELLESMNIKLAEAPERCQGEASTSRPSSVLAINPRKLKPEEELRRIFGSKIVSAEARDQDEGGQFAGASRKVRRLLARGLLRRVPLKPGLIIQPKDHWPQPDNSISLLSVDPEGGEPCFSYAFSAAYQAAQREFERAQASFNPHAIMEFLSRHPYNVDALLAASDVYRSGGQADTADDLLARCVYALEMAWPPHFNPTTDRCRLSLVEENDAFFNALFRYVQSLTRRGMFTSALENAKLLLSLQHLDSEGLLHCIDFLAIKAGQLEFPQALVDQLSGPTSFSVYPNWVYSLPLTRFLRETSGGGVKNPSQETLREGARAVMLLPGVVLAVVEKLKEQGVRLEAEFESHLKQPLFRDSAAELSASLAHLTAIYAERQSSLYKSPEVLRWLKLCCGEAVSPRMSKELPDWLAAREELWPASETNDFSVFRISRFSDSVAAIPQEELQAMMGRGELPLGPNGELPLEQQMLQVLPRELQQQLMDMADMVDFDQIGARVQAGEQVSDEELQQINPFIVLLQTLLPWVDFGIDPGAANEEAPRGDGGVREGDHRPDAGQRE